MTADEREEKNEDRQAHSFLPPLYPLRPALVGPFANPLLSSREYFTSDAPEWFGIAWIVWTLPFLWIAVTMSVRRAADIGVSPWFGMVVLVPVLNLLGIHLRVLEHVKELAQESTDA